MTKAELIKALEDVPDDAEITRYAEGGLWYVMSAVYNKDENIVEIL